jgi:RNA 2',3'-cyclic 3'-phosphodiesterase
VIRAFLAVFPPPGVEAALAEYVGSLRRELRDLAWVKPGNLHLTLRFLGDIEPAQVELARAAADAAVRGRPAFDVSLRDAGAFPSLARPRVAWLGVEEGRAALVDLAAALEAALVAAGLGRADKPFAAHLTVGRVRQELPPSALPRLFASHPSPGFRFRATELRLVESRLDPRGAVYTPLHIARMEVAG